MQWSKGYCNGPLTFDGQQPKHNYRDEALGNIFLLCTWRISWRDFPIPPLMPTLLQWVLVLTFTVELQNPKALVKCRNYNPFSFTHWCLLLAFSQLFAAFASVIKALIPSLQHSINLILMLFTLANPKSKKKLNLISMLIINFNAIRAHISVQVRGLHSHWAVYSRLILREM